MESLPPEVKAIIFQLSQYGGCNISHEFRKLCKELYNIYLNSLYHGIDVDSFKKLYPLQYNYNYLKFIGGNLYTSKLNWHKDTFTPLDLKLEGSFNAILPQGYYLQTNDGNIVFSFGAKDAGEVANVDLLSAPDFSNMYVSAHYSKLYHGAFLHGLADSHQNYDLEDAKNILHFASLDDYLFVIDKECKAKFIKLKDNKVINVDIPNIKELSCVISYSIDRIGRDRYKILLFGYTNGSISFVTFNDEKLVVEFTYKVSDEPIIQIIPAMAGSSTIIGYALDGKGTLYYTIARPEEVQHQIIDTNVTKIKNMILQTKFTEPLVYGVIYIKTNEVFFRGNKTFKMDLDVPIIDVEVFNDTVYLILTNAPSVKPPTTISPKVKDTTPKKPVKTHPSWKEMIKEALYDEDKLSRTKLKHKILNKYPEISESQYKVQSELAIKELLKEGEIKRDKSSFKLSTSE